MSARRKPPVLARTVAALRRARAGLAGPVGFVPTMGALHEGHLSLFRRARRECRSTVASIFVNPTQFGPNEDFERYPRDLERDLEACRSEGVDLVFAPPVAEMYPEGFATAVEVEGPAEGLEGALRPGHFRGVATVCTRLFLLVAPDVAYFGWKDMQQYCVLKRMVEDLGFPLELRPCEVVRAADGVALSSRCRYLSPEERELAPALYRALLRAREAYRLGERDPQALVRAATEAVPEAFDLEYVALRREEDFGEPEAAGPGVRILIAARLGSTRLIDNIPLEAGG